MAALGSAIHLRQTRAFINVRPSDVILLRRPKVATENGGFRLGTPTALPAQTMRKVGPPAETTITTSDGRIVQPTGVMIGLPEVDIQIGDKFTLDGQVHEVLTISRLPEWRVSAEVWISE